MAYLYKDRAANSADKGEVIECTTEGISGFTKGKLYVMQQHATELSAVIDDRGNRNGFNYGIHARIVQTKSSKEVIVGDTIIRIPQVSYFSYGGEHIVGKIETVKKCYPTSVAVKSTYLHLDVGDFLVLATDETANTTPNNINAEEQTMSTNKNTSIELKVNGKGIDLCNTEKKEKPVKTDLEAKRPYSVNMYDAQGTYLDTLPFKTEAKAKHFIKKELQMPSNLGCTYIISKEIKVFTTVIPVVEVK